MMLFSSERSDLAVCNQNGHYIQRHHRAHGRALPRRLLSWRVGHAGSYDRLSLSRKRRQVDAADGRPTFCALVGEDGDRLGDGTLRFVNFLASDAGSSMGERRAFVCFALQRVRCATVKGGLHAHPTCLSTRALLTAGNVAAPATDPCPVGAQMPPCRHPNFRTANRVCSRSPPTHIPPASVSTTNDGGSGPSARSAQCPCKLHNGRFVTFSCAELPSFYGGAL
jgi:hypothetical protein